MENYWMIGILVLIIAAALWRTAKHLRNGGCCSSGSAVIREKKVLTEPIIGEKLLVIDGMHCENCAARVENALNRLDGVLCRVNLRKKTAAVSYSVEVSDDLLRQTVEDRGYQVLEIRKV